MYIDCMKTLPAPTKKRLAVLFQFLSQFGEEKVTSAHIASKTGWTEATVRRDISLIGGAAGGKGGYVSSVLRQKISCAIGIFEKAAPKKCCLVGLGRLGSVLLESPTFDNSSFYLVAGFDSSSNRTEILRSTIPLYPTAQMEKIIRAEKIAFALLAVPSDCAQKAAERLVACGIKGIVNYTNTILSLPSDVVVENVSPSLVLASISAKLYGI